jgi:hypothetical protein
VIGENNTDDNLIFTVEPDVFGTDEVTLKLTSTENLTVSQPMRINITPVNDRPSIMDLPDLSIHYDKKYIFNFEPYINDIDTPMNKLNLKIYDGLIEDHFYIDGLTAVFKYPKSIAGQFLYATVTVSDGDKYANELITIHISDNDPPEIIAPIPNVSLFQGGTKSSIFDLDNYFLDPNGDTLVYSFSKSNSVITIHDNNSVDISAVTEWSGTERIIVKATDSLGAIIEQDILVSILEVNDPPTILTLPEIRIRYDHDYNFDLSRYIQDNDNLHEELDIMVSDPLHIQIDPKNNLGIIINYPRNYLNTSVQAIITVSDNLDFSRQTLNIIITDNYPPQLISQLPSVVFLEDTSINDAINLDKYFVDLDGSVITYSIYNNTLNVTLDENNIVSFSAPHDWFGSEPVSFQAADAKGAFKEVHITVTVLGVNDPPIVLPIPEQYGNENQRWAIDLSNYVVDIDNDMSELLLTVDDYHVEVAGSSLIFHGSPDTQDYVDLRVSDGEFSDSRSIYVNIMRDEEPPSRTMWEEFGIIILIIILIELLAFITAGLVQRKRNTYTVEEVFLIYAGGTLITHLTRQTQANVDDEIFSAMFTAVQEFIHDTFSKGKGAGGSKDVGDSWALDELKLGNYKILIERSKNTYLALIFLGKSSNKLRKIVNRLLNKIEDEYGDTLDGWQGDIDKLTGTEKILEILIKPLDENEEIPTSTKSMKKK